MSSYVPPVIGFREWSHHDGDGFSVYFGGVALCDAFRLGWCVEVVTGRNAGKWCAHSEFSTKRKYTATSDEAYAYLVRTGALHIRRAVYNECERLLTLREVQP